MLKYMQERLKEISTWKGIVSLIAGIAMFFTPDHIDKIIEMTLSTIGITDIFTIERK
jgi:hypothetical protein